MSRLSYIAALLCIVGMQSSAAAMQVRPPGGSTAAVPLTPALEWDKRKEVGERLSALGNDIMGESIDPHTGSISFRHVDIDLPGNSALPVALIRELTQGYFHRYTVDAEFGDWHYAVPRLHVITAVQNASYSSQWRGARCTQPNNVFAPALYSNADPTQMTSYAYPVQYSNGLLLDIPGHGAQHVLSKSPNVSQPFPAAANYVTAKHWYLMCGTATDGGEGFIAIAPNGDRYRFDRYIERAHRNLGAMVPSGGNAGASRIIPRVRGQLMATEVTDVHGNWVRYDYDSSNRLTRIYANDGRSIELSYLTGSHLVASATAHGRTWTYSYQAHDVIDMLADEQGYGKHILSQVTQPDGRSWQFDLLAMHQRPQSGTYCQAAGGTMTLTHPYGLTGQFKVRELSHRMAYAEWMVENTIRCSGAFVNYGTPTFDDIYHAPIETIAVVEKTLSGLGVPTATWLYDYEQDVEEERYPAGHALAGHPIATSGDDPTNWTEVSNPDGSITRYKHYWNILLVSGFNSAWSSKLARLETLTSSGEVVDRYDYSYQLAGVFGRSYVPNSYPYPPFDDILSPSSSALSVQITQVVQQRDGDTFTTEHQYMTDQGSAQYSYSKPIETKVYSNVATQPRVTTTSYVHRPNDWVIGLPSTVHLNQRLQESYQYDSKGRLLEHAKRGQPYASYSYHLSGTAAGRPASITDALGRTTTFSQWQRGRPQLITRADLTTVGQTINNHGWMTHATDARGHITQYSYDSMGRLTLIDYPGSWANTQISYSTTPTGLLQQISRGQQRTRIDYDHFLRPITEHSEALDSGWSAYVTRHYDPMGRESFVSQPALSSQSTAGMASSYDALGRLLSQQETVAPYAQTTHSYLSQHRYRVTDPAGHFTDYLSDGYGGPQGQDYRAIEHSSGVITRLLKNAWGELIELRQQGNHNGFVVDQRHYYDYDALGRVCRHAVPETGVSFYQYDAAGQLTAYANGQSGTGCAVPFNNDRIELSYDALGRQLQVDFTNPASAAISYSYDADGQLLSSSRDGMLWSYDYNALGLLTSEQLIVDGRSYALSYQYNSNAHLQQQTYPSGLVLDYQRDGLGRLLQVQQQGSNLLSAISYHPSGQLASMSYGNGVSYQQQLNAQLLPATISASHANGVALSQSMSYDSRGNLLSLTDHALPSNSRSNSYDGLNRLISASGPWGSGSFVYDALGNLRSKTLGNRTVSLSYNSLNQLSQSNDSGHSGLRQFSYDSRGNVISAGDLQFSYDATDQPISASGAVSGSYHYDGQFKRVKQQVNGNTIYSVYNQAGQLVHIDNLGNQQQTDYLSGPQGNFARISNGVISYLHPDILGSAQSATDANGNLLWQQQYTPFGEELQTVSANHHQVGFTGHISDTDTGLHYMQARYYDPVIGRFYSNDPVGFSVNNPMMFNRYAYANNNPYTYVDPNGQTAVSVGRAAFNFGWRIGGLVNHGIKATTGRSLGALLYDAIHNDSSAPELPTDLVGDQSDDRAGQSRGKRHNSGPLTPENGGSGNAEDDFEKLTGGTGKPVEGRKEGTRKGDNGVTIRPGKEGEGLRIDIPANGDKPPETLHYELYL